MKPAGAWSVAVLVLVLGCGREPEPPQRDAVRAEARNPAEAVASPPADPPASPPVNLPAPPPADPPAPPPARAPGAEMWLELFDDPAFTSVRPSEQAFAVGQLGAYRCSGGTNPAIDDDSPPGEAAHGDGPIARFERIVAAELRRGKSTHRIEASVYRIVEPGADPMAHYREAYAAGFRCLAPYRYVEYNAGRLSAVVRWRDAWVGLAFEGGGNGMRGFFDQVERIIRALAAIDAEALDEHYIHGFDDVYKLRPTAPIVSRGPTANETRHQSMSVGTPGGPLGKKP